jgi:hypothetical protein
MLRTPHDTILFSVVVLTNYNPGPEGGRYHFAADYTAPALIGSGRTDKRPPGVESEPGHM